MTDVSSSNGINTRKKNVGHQCPDPINVCTRLIQEIKLKVADWDNKPDAKIAGILTRAIPAFDLQVLPSRKAMTTTVTLSIPGGHNKVVIPLRVEPIETKGVQISLDHRKEIHLI